MFSPPSRWAVLKDGSQACFARLVQVMDFNSVLGGAGKNLHCRYLKRIKLSAILKLPTWNRTIQWSAPKRVGQDCSFTCLVMCIIGLSCLFVIICNRTSLYLAALAEFPAPAFEGKAVTLWSQNRTLASGTCLWLYTSSTTKVKLGVVSSEPRGSWMLKQVFFCWKIEQRLEVKRS